MPTESQQPVLDLSTSEGGRGYISNLFLKQLKRHDFTKYIAERLAADFACALSQYLDSIHAYDEVKERALFEVEYRAEFEKVRGYPLKALDLESMRDGDSYGIDRAYLNGQWAGWKKHAQSHAKMFEQ